MLGCEAIDDTPPPPPEDVFPFPFGRTVGASEGIGEKEGTRVSNTTLSAKDNSTVLEFKFEGNKIPGDLGPFPSRALPKER